MATDPIAKLRDACLGRGAHGIMGLGRLFRIIDDDGNKSLNFSEFQKGIDEYELGFSRDDLQEIFNVFDVDGSSSISYTEFIRTLRPPMNKARTDLINKAFDKMDKSKDGKINLTDLKGVYVATKHPKFLSGEWTEDQVFRTLLDVFDSKGHEDGTITREEFTNYYAGVSASIDDDVYFDQMMRTAWRLD